jgi:hypothetical protein
MGRRHVSRKAARQRLVDPHGARTIALQQCATSRWEVIDPDHNGFIDALI